MRETGESRQLLCVAKESEEVLGYLVVDTFVNGRSHGGVRMRQDVTPEEIGLLARTMTRKHGFLGLPFGGAKAGVLGDPEATLEERRVRMARFGRAIGELLRKELFVPAADMGTDIEDVRHMLREWLRSEDIDAVFVDSRDIPRPELVALLDAGLGSEFLIGHQSEDGRLRVYRMPD